MGWSNYITVEPTMFLQQAGDTITYVIFQNLFIEKICSVDLGYSERVCELYTASSEDDLSPEEQIFRPIVKEIQAKSSQFLLFNSLVENSFPVFLVLFLGVWSDRHKMRKPPLLLCLLGKMLRSFGLVMNSYYLSWPSFVLLFTVALPHSLGGSNAVFHMSAFSYIADSSVPRHRTWRLGIAEFCWQLGAPVGLYLGAFLYKKGGYLVVFGTSFALHLVSILYTMFFCPEVPKPQPTKRMVFGKHGNYGTYTILPGNLENKRNRYYSETGYTLPTESNDPETNNVVSKMLPAETEQDVGDDNLSSYLSIVTESELETSLSSVEEEPPQGNLSYPAFKNTEQFNHNHNRLEPFRNPKTLLLPPQPNADAANNSPEDVNNNMTVKEIVIGSIKAIIRKRPNHTRKCLISISAIMLLYGIGYNGENNMKYLFTRNRFNWREQQYSLWITFESAVVVVGLMILMPILSKLFKLSDPFCGTIAAFTRASAKLCVALAPKSSYLYLASLIDVPGVIGPLTARSLVSKCVLRDERGKIFAFLGCIEAIVPLIAVPLYSMLYQSTLANCPSAIFYLSAGLYGTICIIFGVLFVAYKLKVIQFTGNDLTTLLGNNDPAPAPGLQYACSMYRRSSLS